MPMIQGIDAGTLIAAFRQGRSDRSTDDKTRLEAERQQQIKGLMGQLFNGQPPATGGVSGQYAPSNPNPAPAAPTFDQAFSAPAMEAIGRGEAPPVLAPAAPAAPKLPQAPSRAPNPQVLAQLIALDPDTGGKLATAFKTMDEGRIKALETKNTALGAASQWLSKYPPEQRQQLLHILEPQLLDAGWTMEELHGKPITDEALRGYISQSMDVDKLIDNELAQREFDAGKSVAVAPGGNVAIIKSDGSARWAIGGGGGDQPTPANTPPAAAIQALKAGNGTPEQFDAIFGPGAAARALGGGGGNATGGFQAGQ